MRKVPMPPRKRKNSRESRVESRESTQGSRQSTADPRPLAQETCETKEAQRGSAAPLSGCGMSDGQPTMPIEKSRGDSRKLNLSKPATHPRAESGSAALTCGKPPAFRPEPDSSSSCSSPAGRLSLPAGEEEGFQDTGAAERQSLSASQAAEPQVIADGIAGNSDKPAPKPLLETLGPALQLLPYQRRWVEDHSALKIVVKARQIGYSFAASIRALLECLKKRTTWIFLSKGERQSRLLMEKVQEHVQSCGILARACESTFFEGTLIKQLEVRFANGSVIYGLPANPDTARGYSGNVTLDEFAFHSDADKIYTALFPTITRGYCLEVISTPNGQQGKFYEIAKAAGLVESGDREIGRSGELSKTENRNSKLETRGDFRISNFEFPAQSIWSAHSCDIYEAIRQGLNIDLQVLRAGCDDETTWQQEYCCQFVSIAENFIPPALVGQCVTAEAAKD